MVSLCFVCLGNICRSPTAEGVFLNLLKEKGLLEHVSVDSAGTAAYHIGKRADARSRRHASLRGYELPSVARQLVVDDLQRFDFIFAMDQQNLEDIQSLASRSPNPARAQLMLFRDMVKGAAKGLSVPDPYYGGDAGFEEVLDICESACSDLLTFLIEKGKLSVGDAKKAPR